MKTPISTGQLVRVCKSFTESELISERKNLALGAYNIKGVDSQKSIFIINTKSNQ